MIIKTVTGVGYGDEGKGLATDFFCRQIIGKVLNIKVNGGAQAGHTVCCLDKNVYNGEFEYKHWIFKQYGAGTFAGADTYLHNTFIVNIPELLKERELISRIYGLNTKMYVDRNCRITLPVDIIFNRYLEDKRTHRHGSCGLGIYETFHRNNDFKQIKIRDIIQIFINAGLEEFQNYLNNLSKDYIEYRYEEIKSEGLEVTKDEYIENERKYKELNSIFIEKLAELAKCNDIIFCNNIDELIEKEKYTGIVCECSQGLELDQFESRNWPHLTPSSTGLINIIKMINESNTLNYEDMECCFITRSYKTKHGAGPFIEEKQEVKDMFNLYDRTNETNKYQGSLKYGVLHLGRIKNLIFKQLDTIEKEVKSSIMITHLDQTNNMLLTNLGNIDIKDIDIRILGVNHTIYKSYGEKYTDIVI